MNKLLSATLVALLLAGCSTTQKKAEVDDRSGTSAATTTAVSPDVAPVDNAATVVPVEEGKVDGAPLAADAVDPRKAAGSLLGERSVYFDFDSFVVKDSYRPLLEAHAGYLTPHSASKIIIQGNTDDRGSREYNLALGQKRAEAVRKALGALGVPDGQMEAVSFGEEKPRMEGDNEEAWAANRRADLVYGDE